MMIQNKHTFLQTWYNFFEHFQRPKGIKGQPKSIEIVEIKLWL